MTLDEIIRLLVLVDTYMGKYDSLARSYLHEALEELDKLSPLPSAES
jgi:hypothetical protein